LQKGVIIIYTDAHGEYLRKSVKIKMIFRLIKYIRIYLRKFLSYPMINKIILPIFKLFGIFISENLAGRLPVYKKCFIKVNPKKGFYMISYSDDEIVSRLYLKGVRGYEYETLNFLKNLVKMEENYVFFDIGANTGIFSLYLASLSSNIKVYAFEPYKKAFERFLKNIELNKFSNIMVYPFAISDNSYKGRFTYKNTQLGISTTNKLVLEEVEKDLEVADVDCISVDDFIAKENIKNLDLIKIDVEGFEFSVLRVL
jgi:FkbM family methyltransferase